MNVSLTPELEKYVNDQVKTGLYNSSSEVIRTAIRLLVKSEAQSLNPYYENYKMWLRQEVQVGLQQAERGEFISSKQLKSHVSERRGRFLKQENS
ncbi:MAG: type II toxin-antitoxin system ParD family antitoxin [Pseudomonadota bacterium]